MGDLKDILAQKIEVMNTDTNVTNDSNLIKEPSDNLILFNHSENSKTVSVVPDFAITLNDARNRIELLQNFVKEMMVSNIDYGLIPNCNKPSLFKSGAEKLCDIFGFSKQIEVINRVEDWEKALFHYEIKTILINKRTGLIEAEGIGCCNNRERKYKSQDGYSIVNSILKMAKKRALIDAVLSATRSSGIFTQDIEDGYSNNYEQNTNNLSTLSTTNVKNYNKKSDSLTKNNTNSNTNTNHNKLPISKSQHTKLISIINQRKLPVEDIRAIMNERYNVNESKYLNFEQADDFIEFLKLYNSI